MEMGKKKIIIIWGVLMVLLVAGCSMVKERPSAEVENPEEVVNFSGDYANYIAFTRGLVLSEIIDRIEVYRGSIWIVDLDSPKASLQ